LLAFCPAWDLHFRATAFFIPDSGGRVIVRNSPNQAAGAVSELFFYGQNNFQADPTVYKQNVQINTPLTIDSHGNLFFGFLAVGPTTIGLQSGIARIAANGKGRPRRLFWLETRPSPKSQ
jgi:hypothetical protein